MTEAALQGAARVTHRRVLKIALPIVLSNATVPILGAVDVGVVGQMGEAAPIGAVGLGAIILSSLYWAFGFLRMGTVGLVGQAEGAGDHAEVSAWLTRALVVAMAGGLLLIVLQPLVFWAAFELAPASDEVERLAGQYLAIRIWTAPAAIAVYALTGWLVAMERTAGVFWVQLVMNWVDILGGPVTSRGRARVAERSVGPGLRRGRVKSMENSAFLPFQLGFSCFFLRTVFSSFSVQLSSSLAEQNTGITTTGLASFSNLLLGWKGADRPAARVN